MRASPMPASSASYCDGAPERASAWLRTTSTTRAPGPGLAAFTFGGAARVSASFSRRTTSASLVWSNTWYQSPTARKGSGVSGHTTRSANVESRCTDSSAPTGTATTSLDGDSCRTAMTAASIVAPVASPSSTRMTMRPFTSGAGRPPRYARSRQSSSLRSSSTTRVTSVSGTRAARINSSLSTWTRQWRWRPWRAPRARAGPACARGRGPGKP